MGRPLRKDVLGTDAIGTYGTNTPGDSSAGVKVTGYFGGSSGTYYIYKQRGAKTFVVTDDGSTFHTGVLQSTAPNANGEIAIVGVTEDGADASETYIAKLTKRVATDFSGNKYTWRLGNYQDSTGDQIFLTAI
jgi:hypothetical protein